VDSPPLCTSPDSVPFQWNVCSALASIDLASAETAYTSLGFALFQLSANGTDLRNRALLTFSLYVELVQQCFEVVVCVQDDSSLTRSHAYMLKLFSQSDLQLRFSAKQRNFPKELFAVHMYALQPNR